ncbi:hypothetical protein BP5796_02754 [Coleophoma crateriformis]|uniref:Uncharacterized protein n=1 Tax=Coleophoma crateriformis TaxID=565419 RepID=A0A3D8SZB6_9HELO|nr:hypothetical protein BP5796_02754 [Coleophoma crateriformis]
MTFQNLPINPLSHQKLFWSNLILTTVFLPQYLPQNVFGLASSLTPPPNYAAGFITGNFFLAYAVLSTRFIKTHLKLDHNVCPREDLNKYGEKMVTEGKMTAATLRMIKRWEAAHANAVENFPLFFGSVLLALHAGVPVGKINGLAALYTLARCAYALAYINIETHAASYGRSVLWWVGNVSCLTLIKMAGSRL